MTPLGGVDLLDHDFLALEPDTQWVTDIAEINLHQGKLYLCIVLDLSDQRVVCRSMHERQRVPRAAQMAATPDGARADVFDYLERHHKPRKRRRVARRDQTVAALLEPSLISGENPRPLQGSS